MADPLATQEAMPEVSEMTEGPPDEEDASVRKRRATQVVMQDKSLTPIDHTTRI